MSSQRSYNKTILIGRLGADPELKTGGKSDYANFSICNSSVDKEGREEVQWHRVKAFGKQAHLCKDHQSNFLQIRRFVSRISCMFKADSRMSTQNSRFCTRLKR